MAARYAFVTLLTSDSYLPGALALAGALEDVHHSDQQVVYETVCLVTPHTLNVRTIKLLRRAFDVVIGVEVIVQPDAQRLALLGRPDLDTVLTKLHVFRLTQYSKVIFLDADVLPVRPLSHLFGLDHEFAAAPDVGWPDIFNSGVMVLSPGEDKFNQLYDLLNTQGSWDGGDQGLLNEWRGDNWHRLRFTYNTTPTAAYTYAPAYERFGSQISAIHFIGPDKPWHSPPHRPPSQTTTGMNEQTSFAESTPPCQRIYDYASLEDRWRDVYDRHCRSQSGASNSDFEVPKYLSAWDKRRSSDTSEGEPTGSVLSLAELRRAALEGVNSLNTLSGTSPSDEGEYRSMPLEGRFDLMPPLTRAERKRQQQASSTPSSTEASVELSQSPERPSTPISQAMLPCSTSFGRWATLSSPEPNKFPPAPRTQLLSLPSTPLQKDPSPPKPTPTRVVSITTDSPLSHIGPPLSKQHAATQSPANLPPAFTCQADTYFTSDQLSPSTLFTPSGISTISDDISATNVEVLPPQSQRKLAASFNPLHEVQHLLLRRSSYYNNNRGRGSPGRDPSSVTPVFPWEARPRHAPGRVFPGDGLPGTPGTVPFTSTAVPSTPERIPSGYLSVLPSPFHDIFCNAPNARDDSGGVGKNSSKLRLHIPPSPLAPLSVLLSESSRKYREAKSEGGGIEDEVSTKDQRDDHVQSPGESVELTTRQGVLCRSIGVHNDTRDLKDGGVQVELIPSQESPSPWSMTSKALE